MPKQHTRNVAGYKVSKVSNAVYQQDLDNGKIRWFVRFKTKNEQGYHWRYTPPFALDETTDKTSSKSYLTLTACVMAANK